MIARLTGIVAESGFSGCVLDVHGVGKLPDHGIQRPVADGMFPAEILQCLYGRHEVSIGEMPPACGHILFRRLEPGQSHTFRKWNQGRYSEKIHSHRTFSRISGCDGRNGHGEHRLSHEPGAWQSVKRGCCRLGGVIEHRFVGYRSYRICLSPVDQEFLPGCGEVLRELCIGPGSPLIELPGPLSVELEERLIVLRHCHR